MFLRAGFFFVVQQMSNDQLMSYGSGACQVAVLDHILRVWKSTEVLSDLLQVLHYTCGCWETILDPLLEISKATEVVIFHKCYTFGSKNSTFTVFRRGWYGKCRWYFSFNVLILFFSVVWDCCYQSCLNVIILMFISSCCWIIVK